MRFSCFITIFKMLLIIDVFGYPGLNKDVELTPIETTTVMTSTSNSYANNVEEPDSASNTTAESYEYYTDGSNSTTDTESKELDEPEPTSDQSKDLDKAEEPTSDQSKDLDETEEPTSDQSKHLDKAEEPTSDQSKDLDETEEPTSDQSKDLEEAEEPTSDQSKELDEPDDASEEQTEMEGELNETNVPATETPAVTSKSYDYHTDGPTLNTESKEVDYYKELPELEGHFERSNLLRLRKQKFEELQYLRKRKMHEGHVNRCFGGGGVEVNSGQFKIKDEFGCKMCTCIYEKKIMLCSSYECPEQKLLADLETNLYNDYFLNVATHFSEFTCEVGTAYHSPTCECMCVAENILSCPGSCHIGRPLHG